jgi:hypothetical protein
MTGEIVQPIRVHYEVLDVEALRAAFATLHCLAYDTSRQRWVWLYTKEARRLRFKNTAADDQVVLGEFVLKGNKEVVLNLRSFERAKHAIVFFDKYIPRTVARVTAATVSNTLLSIEEATSLTSLDHYFEHTDVVVHDSESIAHTLQDIASKTTDTSERLALLGNYMDEKTKAPLPPMEKVDLHYYDEGIRSVEALITPRQVIAMQHWRGNTSYTYQDFVHDMLRHGKWGKVSRCMLICYRIIGFVRNICFGGLKRVYEASRGKR